MEKWGFGSSVFLVDKAGFDYQNAGVGIPKGHLANFGRRCFNSKSGRVPAAAGGRLAVGGAFMSKSRVCFIFQRRHSATTRAVFVIAGTWCRGGCC